MLSRDVTIILKLLHAYFVLNIWRSLLGFAPKNRLFLIRSIFPCKNVILCDWQDCFLKAKLEISAKKQLEKLNKIKPKKPKAMEFCRCVEQKILHIAIISKFGPIGKLYHASL